MISILLVEDHDLNRDMLSRRLRKRGYAVEEAIDGEDGLIKARTLAPDLILMDMNLPGQDGWETTRILKSDPLTASTPIIGLSAHTLAVDRSRSISAGCADYETKPIDFDRLLSKIAVVIGS